MSCTGFPHEDTVVSTPLLRPQPSSRLRPTENSSVRIGNGIVLTVGLITLICVLALWLVSLQFAVLIVLLCQASLGLPVTVSSVVTKLTRFARKLVRPSSLPLSFYLFVLLPLTGFGFTSVFAQGIAIPSFITGELLKSASSAVALTIFMVMPRSSTSDFRSPCRYLCLLTQPEERLLPRVGGSRAGARCCP